MIMLRETIRLPCMLYSTCRHQGELRHSMRTENRFEQYDLSLELPTPLISREHRLTVGGRIGARGQELQPLDTAGL